MYRLSYDLKVGRSPFCIKLLATLLRDLCHMWYPVRTLATSPESTPLMKGEAVCDKATVYSLQFISWHAVQQVSVARSGQSKCTLCIKRKVANLQMECYHPLPTWYLLSPKGWRLCKSASIVTCHSECFCFEVLLQNTWQLQQSNVNDGWHLEYEAIRIKAMMEVSFKHIWIYL